jgi:hypothetical protein
MSDRSPRCGCDRAARRASADHRATCASDADPVVLDPARFRHPPRRRSLCRRRAAVARIAHLICELFLRLGVVGLTRRGPLQAWADQADLADATGLTSIHVNGCSSSCATTG